MVAMLKGVEPHLAPNYIHCDFELAAINAFKNAFPNVLMSGCFFHLVKNLKKHIGELGLLTRYNNDADFALAARMVSSLAFVPLVDLDNALEILADSLPNELQPLV